MSDDGDRPPHVRVAEAGFGEAVMAKGFRRASKIQWKKETDEIVWRVAVVTGSDFVKAPFDIVQGVHVKGLDELYARIQGKKLSERMTGTSHRAHSWSTLSDMILARQMAAHRAECDAAMAAWREEHGFWRFLSPRPDLPDFERDVKDVRFLADSGLDRRDWFDLSLGPLDQIVEYVAGQWEKVLYPRTVEWDRYEPIYRALWGSGTRKADFGWEDAFAAAKLAGDAAHIRAMAEAKFERARQPVEFFYREARRRGEHSWDEIQRRKREGGRYWTKKERALLAKHRSLLRCRWLLEWSEKLDLGLEDPGLDWEFLERHQKLLDG